MLRTILTCVLLLFYAANANAANYYFSSSTGNDSNNCTTTSTPCQTIAKAQSLSYAAGSTISFKAGDTFPLPTTLTWAGPRASVAQNVFGALTVTTYGGGTCNPIAGVISGCATFVGSGSLKNGLVADNVSNFTIQNVRVFGNLSSSFAGGGGINWFSKNGVSPSGGTIENSEAQGFNYGVYVSGPGSNVSVLNNLVHGASPNAQDGIGILVTNGIHTATVQGNLVYNIGGIAGNSGAHGDGIIFTNGVVGALDQFNVTHDNGGNNTLCGGPVGNWTYDSGNITIQFNESYRMGPFPTYTSGCDFNGFDFDGGTYNSVMQYNYSHDNFGDGYLMFASDASNQWANNTIRYNISERDASNYGGGGLGICCGNAHGTTGVYNNTVYSHSAVVGDTSGKAACIVLGASGTAAAVFANNVCINDTSSVFVWAYSGGAIALDGNVYYEAGSAPGSWNWAGTGHTAFSDWQTASGQDAHSSTTNPNLTGVGAGGTCNTVTGPQPCPSAYHVQSGSPVIGTGLDLRQAPYSFNVGTRDYFGNTIPHTVGTGFNRGADGSPGDGAPPPPGTPVKGH